MTHVEHGGRGDWTRTKETQVAASTGLDGPFAAVTHDSGIAPQAPQEPDQAPGRNTVYRVEDLPKRMHSRIRVEEESGCWVWTAALASSTGYGRQGYGGFVWYSHRLAYSLLRGSIPEGLSIDHLCRNRACCNPAHLEIVTHRENCLRGVSFAAVNAAKTHCKRGHEFTPENTFRRNGRRPGRECIACRKERRAKQALANTFADVPYQPAGFGGDA